jgi:transposase
MKSMNEKSGATPRHYPADFKRNAVGMVLSGRGLNAVAKDLGIPKSCLQRWKRRQLESMDASAPDGSASPSELAAENERLRRELAYVTEQRDILKKTIRIFGEEQGRARR